MALPCTARDRWRCCAFQGLDWVHRPSAHIAHRRSGSAASMQQLERLKRNQSWWISTRWNLSIRHTETLWQVNGAGIQAARIIRQRIFDLVDAKAVRNVVEEVVARRVAETADSTIIALLVPEQLHRSKNSAKKLCNVTRRLRSKLTGKCRSRKYKSCRGAFWKATLPLHRFRWWTDKSWARRSGPPSTALASVRHSIAQSSSACSVA